jgi:SAM-dependent methyltransferase
MEKKMKDFKSPDDLDLFEMLEKINSRPEPFEFYSAPELWTDEYTSEQMLKYHLNEELDISSRNIDFINRSVQWIISRFEIGSQKKIADFGCGPGLYTIRLANTGADITGIDFSKRSIQFARERASEENLDINYVNRNYLEFDTKERFDLILMIMCDYCALSPAQRKVMLAKFCTFLNPGGVVLLDVYSLNAFANRKENATCDLSLLDGFWSASKYYGFQNTFKYEKEMAVLDKYTLIEANRIRTIYNWLQYFSPESLAEEFMENGFTIEDVFANVAGDRFDPSHDEFAIIARTN